MQKDTSSLLLEIIEFLKLFERHQLLGKLPKGSWQATVSQDNEGLYIGIIRNDHLLMENMWHEIADPTQWLFMFIPPISKKIASIRDLVPGKLKITFSVKSEVDEWVGKIDISDLIAAVDSGEISQFGSMMAMLDLDVIDY